MAIHVDLQKKLDAIADLESGDSAATVTARYGVSKSALYDWKQQWDRGELGDDPPPAAVEPPKPEPAPPPPPPPPPPSEAKPERATDDTTEPKDEAMPKAKGPNVLRGVDPKKPGLTLPSGAVLPQFPPQKKGAGRNSFPDEFRYPVAKALLAREVTLAEVSKHYQIHDTLLRKWTDAMTAGKIQRPPGRLNGAATAPAPAPRQAELIDLVPEPGPAWDPHATPEPKPASSQLVPYREPMHPAQVLAEMEHLRRENRRLKRRLEQALNMVLDDDDPADGRG